MGRLLCSWHKCMLHTAHTHNAPQASARHCAAIAQVPWMAGSHPPGNTPPFTMGSKLEPMREWHLWSRWQPYQHSATRLLHFYPAAHQTDPPLLDANISPIQLCSDRVHHTNVWYHNDAFWQMDMCTNQETPWSSYANLGCGPSKVKTYGKS